MLKVEDSTDISIKIRSGKKIKLYHFRCKNCSKDIKLRKSDFKKATGLCRPCSGRQLLKINRREPTNKKRPYERNYNTFKKNAHKQVDITYDEYVGAYCIDSKCHYCLVEINRSKYGNSNGAGYFLDRKDNNISYTLNNCVNCCTKCNFAKSDKYTYEEWYGMTEYFRNKALTSK